MVARLAERFEVEVGVLPGQEENVEFKAPPEPVARTPTPAAERAAPGARIIGRSGR